MTTERHEPPARWSYGWSATVDNQATANYPGGVTVGAPTGGDKGIGSGNFQTLWINGVLVSTSGGVPGGTTGQVQYNNAGAFGGIAGTVVSGSNITFGQQVTAGAGAAGAGFLGTNLIGFVARTALSSAADGSLTISNNAVTNSFTVTASPAGTATFGGTVASSGSLSAAGTGSILWSGRTRFLSSADGLWMAQNNGSTAVATQIGTTTNDNAAAGGIGEFISSVTNAGSSVPLTNNIAADVTTISLTAGDWDISGMVYFDAQSGVTTTTANICWISQVAATQPTPPNGGAYAEIDGSFPAGSDHCLAIATTRVSLAAAATLRLGALSNFLVGTKTAYGFIGARRAR